MSTNSSKTESFLSLVERVQACRRCPRMEESARVLGLGCGPLDAEMMFVGEAPGRLGADDTHLPFHGDKAGNNFESLISQVGISRYDVFVTNAVLCNPKDARGNNSTPTSVEVANCAGFLREQVELIGPKVVVTLGATALKASSIVAAHELDLRNSVRTSNRWFGRELIPAYHPGQRAMVHRSFANQLADYQFISERLRRSGKVQSRKGVGRPREADNKLARVTAEVMRSHSRGMSYFALHKLIYLSEVAHMELAGERIVNAYVVRQKDGPYYVDLHLSKLKGLIPEVWIGNRSGSIWLEYSPQLEFAEDSNSNDLSSREIESISRTISRYGRMSDFDLKRVCYLSRPMRELLRQERSQKVNLFNVAVLPYKAKRPGR